MSRIDQLLEFIAQSEADSFLIHALALEYVKESKYEEAQVYFERNEQLNPTYIATYYHLGKLYQKLGANEKALAIYTKGMDRSQAAGDMKTYNEIFLAKDFLEDEMD